MGRGKHGHRVVKPLPLQGVQAPLGSPPGGGKAPEEDPVDHCNVIMS